jgi:cell division septum initiation protein DivIVA
MRVIDLLAELEEVVEKGNAVPFSSKALIDPEELIEIIDEIRDSLPEELTEAKKIVADRKKIISTAQSEAEHMKAEAEKRLKELIDTNEITKTATAQANEIMRNANASAKALKTGTQNYSDKLLYSLQLQLKEMNEKIEQNRRELKNMK